MTAPEIRSLEPLPHQREILDEVVSYANALIGAPGRGWGQDALRAMIAQAVIDGHTRHGDGYAKYRVATVYRETPW